MEAALHKPYRFPHHGDPLAHPLADSPHAANPALPKASEKEGHPVVSTTAVIRAVILCFRLKWCQSSNTQPHSSHRDDHKKDSPPAAGSSPPRSKHSSTAHAQIAGSPGSAQVRHHN